MAVTGSARALTREQKQYNKLIAQIEATRRDLERWRAFVPELLRRQTTEVQPILARLREKRLALVTLFDGVMDGKALKKGERAKVADILLSMLRELLAEEEAPELVRLYNKYSDITYEEEQEDDSALMQAFTSATFGVELDQDEIKGTPDEVAQRIQEKFEAEELKREARRSAKAAKKSPKAAARDAAREQAAQGASKSVREVYRKLASELHPDREPDPVERERKTKLMQKVNQAYDKGDLLALLELQLQIEQINPADLTNMARDRLVHFNTVLSEQLQRLRDELEDITAPFALLAGGSSARDLSPQAINKTLDAEISELQQGVRSLEQDLRDYRDIAKLKQSLRRHRVGASAMEELALMEEMMMMAQPAGRRRRRR